MNSAAYRGLVATAKMPRHPGVRHRGFAPNQPGRMGFPFVRPSQPLHNLGTQAQTRQTGLQKPLRSTFIVNRLAMGGLLCEMMPCAIQHRHTAFQ